MPNRVEEIDDFVPIRTALISVTDKGGLPLLVDGLLEHCPDIEIVSTGGTYKKLGEYLGDRAEGVLTSIEDFTGKPEIAGGLVKSLGRAKSLGTLTDKYNQAHQQTLQDEDVDPIDLVVCNLYPFADAVAREGSDVEDARGNIDIGGPTMLREATKNFLRVVALTNPEQYEGFVNVLVQNKGCTPLAYRFERARDAARMLATDATAVADYFEMVLPSTVQDAYPRLHEGGR